MKASRFDTIVARFLACPLPKTVASDLCVTIPYYAHLRTGTNLLTAIEAREVLGHSLMGMLSMDGRVAWVIDNGWSGERLRYRGMDAHGCIRWVRNVDDALQFARRKDAEAFAAEDIDAMHIVRHIIIGEEDAG